MAIGRVIGWVFIVAALGVAGWELYVFFATGRYTNFSLGQLWFTISPASLNLTQAGIERHVLPALWDPVLITALRAPAWITFALIGLLLIWVCRNRRRRRRFH